MDVGIQTDHVDPKELLNLLIQQHMEQENSPSKRRRSDDSEEGTSLELMKHNQQQDPDAIHRLGDGTDTPKSEPDQTPLQRSPSIFSGRARTKQHPSKISFARGSKKCPSDTKPCNSPNNHARGKHLSEQSLSDRICQVVWSRKESAPFVTPLGSRRVAHHSSARRGTAPNVPPMRQYFESKPDAFGARSQSFKGSTSSGSVKRKIALQRDPLLRRASGDTAQTSVDSASVAYRALLPSLKAKNKMCRRGANGSECDCSGEISTEFGNDCHHHHHHHHHHHKNCNISFGQNYDSPYSSTTGSGQNLSCSLVPPVASEPFEKKMGGLLVHHGSSFKSQSSSHDGEVDNNSRMKRQISMTLSIPSREDSVRSCSSSKSYGSYSASAIPIATGSSIFPCSSKNAIVLASVMATGNEAHDGGRERANPTSPKLVRYGSNPDVFPSRRAKWKQEEQEILHQLEVNRKVARSNRSLVGSNCNIETIFSGDSSSISGRVSKNNSRSNLKDKKKQEILSQKKRNEKVAWAVHLGFSSLLILAITCIVVFLRISSNITSPSSSYYYPNSTVSIPQNEFSTFTNVSSSSFIYDDNMTSEDSSVRKENENLLQSIQPSLNLHNITTPQPSTHTQQVHDNSNDNEESGQSIGDKSIPSIQSGQSLTRTKEELTLSSSSSSDNTQQGEDIDEQQKSNNETTHLGNNSSSNGGGGDGGAGGGSSFLDRSNKNDSSSKVAGNSNNNPSSKSISIRPKRRISRPSTELKGGDIEDPPPRNSNIIINVLNEKVHSNVIKENPSGLMKARHLESTIIRFLKNSASSSGMRERRNLDLESRKL